MWAKVYGSGLSVLRAVLRFEDLGCRDLVLGEVNPSYSNSPLDMKLI